MPGYADNVQWILASQLNPYSKTTWYNSLYYARVCMQCKKIIQIMGVKSSTLSSSDTIPFRQTILYIRSKPAEQRKRITNEVKLGM